MIDDILKDINQRMQQAILHVQNELNKVRTGRANPEMFNSLQTCRSAKKLSVTRNHPISHQDHACAS